MYIQIMAIERMQSPDPRGSVLFPLDCACQNLRRLTRVVSRLYDEELRKIGLEVTHFGVLTALGRTGETNQKRLSAGLAMDSTTLTRTLSLLRRHGWVSVRVGRDRRERLFRMTQEGERQLAAAQSHWERAQRRLQREFGDGGWKRLTDGLLPMTEAALKA
jgi:DNA-binding MarR family transcriptional regulator